jgi:hypothetical protein
VEIRAIQPFLHYFGSVRERYITHGEELADGQENVIAFVPACGIVRDFREIQRRRPAGQMQDA